MVCHSSDCKALHPCLLYSLQTLGDKWVFRGSWRETLARHLRPDAADYAPAGPIAPKDCHSEALYRSWLCAHLAMDPAWLETETVPRRSGLTLEEFRAEFEIPNRPVILTDAVSV